MNRKQRRAAERRNKTVVQQRRAASTMGQAFRSAESERIAPSALPGPTPSQWHARPAAEHRAIERLDSHAGLRNKLREVAADKSEWAGIPLPIGDKSLVIEPSYPFAEAFAKKPEPMPEGVTIRNTFWSEKRKCTIFVYEDNGRITYGLIPGIHHFNFDLRTLGCSFAWGIEQESNAIHLLGTLVKHIAFKQYMLTGMFMETSERSGITYVFRRLRPTVAIKPDRKLDRMRILCALCMHPIAYYSGSWAGAMCPTDDVIAHLQLMRGDEPMFWRRANQHPAWSPQAGL